MATTTINRQCQDQGFGMTVVMKGWFPFCPFFFFRRKEDTNRNCLFMAVLEKSKGADSINRSWWFIELHMREDQEMVLWPYFGSSWGHQIGRTSAKWSRGRKINCGFKAKVREGQTLPRLLGKASPPMFKFSAGLCHCLGFSGVIRGGLLRAYTCWMFGNSLIVKRLDG